MDSSLAIRRPRVPELTGYLALPLLWLVAIDASGQTQLPYLVKDTNPGNPSTLNVPKFLTALNGIVVFKGPKGELWKSDGTGSGTALVKNVVVDGTTTGMAASGGYVYFGSQGPSDVSSDTGSELWRTDGTTGGTVLVKDLRPGSSGSSPNSFIDVNGTVFFVACDSSNGCELWKTDGSASGSVLVKDIRSGSSSSDVTRLRNVNGVLVFKACDLASGCEPWRSDGTSAGTFMLKDIAPGSDSGLDVNVSTPAVVGGTMFFPAWDPTIGYELWKTDGSQAGTQLVKDLVAGVNLVGPRELTNVGGRLYYQGCSGTTGNCGLVTSDGSSAGTSLIANLLDIQNLTDVNGTAYFFGVPVSSSAGYELWKSNGTLGTTVMVKDIRPGSNGSWPSSTCTTTLRNFNGTLVFTANDGTNGVELWKSDGSAAGTVMIKDLYTGSTSGTPNSGCPGYTLTNTAETPSSFIVTGNQIFFTATDAVNGIELWAMRQQPVLQPFFAVDTLETPFVGDFNGDLKTDIITFTRQNPSAFGDVYVALSDGTQFGANTKWHDFFAINTSEQVVIGDYDGDGKDDIATWLSNTSRQAYVALSLGTGMAQEAVWVSAIGSDPSDVLQAGDANGDGKDDLICFARKEGKVYVALSTGAAFQAPSVWHAFFAVSTYERPRAADLNGDGKADIVTFATDSPTAFGDVYVALSNGASFVDGSGVANSSTKWHDFFAIRPTEIIRTGDAGGDKKDDFFTFLPVPFGQAYSAQSTGAAMGSNVLWRSGTEEKVMAQGADLPFVGDVNGDGKADIIVFAQGEGRVYVSFGS